MEYTHKFKNGVSLTGTFDQIKQYADLVGETLDINKFKGSRPSGFYLSESKGTFVKISDMETSHIIYALNKHAVKYLTELPKKSKMNVEEYIKMFLNLADDLLINDLFTELSSR